MSHTAANLDTGPLMTGSIVFAVLVLIGLLSVVFAYTRNKIEAKDVGMVMIFVLTAGFSMWIVWFSTWMVRGFLNRMFAIHVAKHLLLLTFFFDSSPLLKKLFHVNLSFVPNKASMAPTDVPTTTKR